LDEIAAPPRRRRSVMRTMLDRDWLLALSLAFFVAVVVWFGRSVQDFFRPSSTDITVPPFVGQTIDDANDECTRIHLTCSIIAHRPSDRYPQDVVMAQEPLTGTRVREGRAVALIASTGVSIFPMPDLRYESLRNVNLILGHAKLHLAKTRIVANDDVPANHVVDQNPPPLSSVREGTDVSVTLSKGPPSSIKVPNMVNLNVDDARQLASQNKVHIGQIVWTPFGPYGPARGVVVRQAPAAGTSIDPFNYVSLQVSAGPTVYGYLVRQVHIGATVPPRDDAAHVRIVLRDETGTWNVYDGDAQGGQKLDFNVTAVGTAGVDTYINNELLSHVTIGVEPPLPPPPSPPPTPAPTRSP
jgi:beta-lactam-binding protein with PASTA domain